MAEKYKVGQQLPPHDDRIEIDWLLQIFWSNELQISLMGIHIFGAPADVRDHMQKYLEQLKVNQRKLERYIRTRQKEVK